MITRLSGVASAFVAGLFANVVIGDGANGWISSHLTIVVGFTAAAILLVAAR